MELISITFQLLQGVHNSIKGCIKKVATLQNANTCKVQHYTCILIC